MTSEHFADASQEVHEHRGMRFTVWRTFILGDRRRPQRFWHYETCGKRNPVPLESKTDAMMCARWVINETIGYTEEKEEIYDEAGQSRQAKITEWLKSVTVERGFSQAEAKTAQEKSRRT